MSKRGYEREVQQQAAVFAAEQGIVVECLSISGAAPNSQSVEFVEKLIRQGWVAACVAVPPSDTWVTDCGACPAIQSRRRLLRSEEEPWGVAQLGKKGDWQYALLLCVSCGVACVVGHPAPSDKSSHPSVWKLTLTRFLSQLPGVDLIGVSEAWYAEQSTELIYLLSVGLPTLLERLDSAARPEPEHSFTPAGSESSATVCRERPARLCKALAASLCDRAISLCTAPGPIKLAQADEVFLSSLQVPFDPYDLTV